MIILIINYFGVCSCRWSMFSILTMWTHVSDVDVIQRRGCAAAVSRCSSESRTHALTPTMPPKKRRRRSKSVPGRTSSESRVHRYFVRRRPNSGLLQPVPVHADVAGSVRPAFATNPPAASAGAEDVCRNATRQPAFHFTDSNLSDISGSSTESPSFRRVRIAMPVRPLSDCEVESAASSSASLLSWMPVVRNDHVEEAAGVAPLQPVARCRSQPGALFARASSLKRRREQCRPRLDFRKMREVIMTCGRLPFTAVSVTR